MMTEEAPNNKYQDKSSDELIAEAYAALGFSSQGASLPAPSGEPIDAALLEVMALAEAAASSGSGAQAASGGKNRQAPAKGSASASQGSKATRSTAQQRARSSSSRTASSEPPPPTGRPYRPAASYPTSSQPPPHSTQVYPQTAAPGAPGMAGSPAIPVTSNAPGAPGGPSTYQGSQGIPQQSTPRKTTEQRTQRPTTPPKKKQGSPLAKLFVSILVLFFFLPQIISCIGEAFDTPSGSSAGSSTSSSSYTSPIEYISTEMHQVGNDTSGYTFVPVSFVMSFETASEDGAARVKYVDTETGMSVTLARYFAEEGQTQKSLFEKAMSDFEAEGAYVYEYETDYSYLDNIKGLANEISAYLGTTRIAEYFFTASDGTIHSIRFEEPEESRYIIYEYEQRSDSGGSYEASFNMRALMTNFSMSSEDA